jgi:hypothetical protein
LDYEIGKYWIVPEFNFDGFDTLKSNIGPEIWRSEEGVEVEPAEQLVLR